MDRATLAWSGHQLIDFYPVADLELKGFPTYYRWPGLGAPLAARVVPKKGEQDLLAPRARVPVTAVLRPTDPSRRLGEGDVQATLELYTGYGDEAVKVGTREVPLEAEPTAALALALAETDIWKREVAGFLHGTGVIAEKGRLVSNRPYQPGLIPVAFVHGTGWSAARWAALYNDLDNDPRIHDHYQFWFFSYETGNPILYSAMLLREALQHAVTRLDPQGHDPALRRMAVWGRHEEAAARRYPAARLSARDAVAPSGIPEGCRGSDPPVLYPAAENTPVTTGACAPQGGPEHDRS